MKIIFLKALLINNNNIHIIIKTKIDYTAIFAFLQLLLKICNFLISKIFYKIYLLLNQIIKFNNIEINNTHKSFKKDRYNY